MKKFFLNSLINGFHYSLPIIAMAFTSISFLGGYVMRRFGHRWFALIFINNLIGGYFLYYYYLFSFTKVLNILDYDISHINWLPTYIYNLIMLCAGYVVSIYFFKKETNVRNTIIKVSTILLITLGSYFLFSFKYDYFDFLEVTSEFLSVMDEATPEQNQEFMDLLNAQ